MKQIKNTSQKNKSDTTWLYKELGIYNSDPEKDKKLNNELKSFLKSIGCKPARIKIKNNLSFLYLRQNNKHIATIFKKKLLAFVK